MTYKELDESLKEHPYAYVSTEDLLILNIALETSLEHCKDLDSSKALMRVKSNIQSELDMTRLPKTDDDWEDYEESFELDEDDYDEEDYEVLPPRIKDDPNWDVGHKG